MSNINKEEFKSYLERIEDINYQGYANKNLSKNSSLVDRMKFDICQKIISYQQKENFSPEQVAEKIGLTIPETKDILFSYIDKFTLDRLANYVDKIFAHEIDFSLTLKHNSFSN